MIIAKQRPLRAVTHRGTVQGGVNYTFRYSSLRGARLLWYGSCGSDDPADEVPEAIRQVLQALIEHYELSEELEMEQLQENPQERFIFIPYHLI